MGNSSIQPAPTESLRTSPVTEVQTTTYPASGDTYNGIRPYSGSTRVITPVTTATTPSVMGAAPPSTGDMVIKLQQLEADVRRLNGIVEEQAAALRRLEAQSLERYVDIDRRLASGVPAGGATTAPGNTDRVNPTGGVVTGTTAGGAAVSGEEAAYRAAYELVRNRAFDPAVQAFQDFLTEYPLGQYAPNAHYWLGELYLVTTPPEPELARQSFKLLLDQYPDNAKVPDAIYKLGRVHFIKGNRERAREYLDRVIADYSGDNHPAAQLARDFIKENF